MTHSWVRGHGVISDDGENWHYEDTDEPVKDDRPCQRCGRYPTVDGHDACIGHIDDSNIVSACCGHGRHSGCVIVKKHAKDIYVTDRGQEIEATELSPIPKMLLSLDELRMGTPTMKRVGDI